MRGEHRTWSSRSVAWGLALLLATLSHQAGAQDRGPRVLWVEGTATVAPLSADGKPGPALLLDALDPLTPGEQLALAPGGRAWVLVDELTVAALEGPGTFAVRSDAITAAESDDAESRAPQMWRLSPGTIAPEVSHTPWDAFRVAPAGAAGLALLSPVETAVRDPRPVCRWRRTEPTASGADDGDTPTAPAAGPTRETYEVALLRLEPDGSLSPVEMWRGLVETSRRPWEALEDGQYYVWRVRDGASSVEAEAPVEATAWFRTMTERERRHADTALELLARAIAAHPDAAAAMSVLQATRLEQLGLLGDAEQRWQELALARPESEAMARRLARVRARALIVPRRTATVPLPFGRRLGD